MVPKASTLAKETHLKITEIIPDLNSHTLDIVVYIDLNYSKFKHFLFIAIKSHKNVVKITVNLSRLIKCLVLLCSQ